MTAPADEIPDAEPDEPAIDADALLNVAAARAAARPECLAWVLAQHQANEGLDDMALSGQLGIDPSTLLDLRLCLRPRAASPEQFRRDVEEIAAAFGADADALMAVVKSVDVLE